MNTPLQVTFRDIAHSEAVETYVRKKADKLEALSDRLIRCRVALEAPHRHHAHGTRYRVRIELDIPGRHFVVGRPHRGYEDLYAAIDRSFDEAQRMLADEMEARREATRSVRPAPTPS